jgi:hypothetical protein
VRQIGLAAAFRDDTTTLSQNRARFSASAVGEFTSGSSFDSFLANQGILEDCEEQAIKQILADQIKAAMEKESLTKRAMAGRMQTSRRALDRLL